MNSKAFNCIFLISLLTCTSHIQLVAQGVFGKAHKQKGANLNYLVSLPDSYSEDGNGSPLILFLHGGDGSNTKHHPKKYATQANIEFSFMVVAPQCSSGCNWSTVDYDGLLNEVTEMYNVDKNRIYVTGYSMGGYGTWSAMTKSPDLFAAAVPIAGGGNTVSICNAKNIAVWAFHGDKDSVTPYSGSKKLIDSLKGCGANAKLETLKDEDHWIWPAIYKDQRLYDWLLQQKKKH